MIMQDKFFNQRIKYNFTLGFWTRNNLNNIAVKNVRPKRRVAEQTCENYSNVSHFDLHLFYRDVNIIFALPGINVIHI